MNSMSTMTKTAVPVWGKQIDLKFDRRGDGPPLVYLHPAAGLTWDPFLDRLAEQYQIYAPEFPGTSVGDPYAIHKVDSLSEAVLFYEEAFKELGLVGASVIGQSFGGMLALELAATFPKLFSRVVVLDPIGLWSESAPVVNWNELPITDLPGLLFKNPSSPEAKAALALPQDTDAAFKAQAQLVWNLGCTGKMVWPIPDLGLSRRLHRVEAQTLIIWGQDDALVSAKYADDFHRMITNSRIELVANCGHIPQVERPEATFKIVSAFLNSKFVNK